MTPHAFGLFAAVTVLACALLLAATFRYKLAR